MVDKSTSIHPRGTVERVVARHLRSRTSEFVTLEYIVSLGSIVASVICLDAALKAAFTLWNNGTVELGMLFSWFLPVSGGYVGAIWTGLAAVVFALLGMFFHRRTSASIAARPAYAGRQAYKIVTYAALALLSAILLTAILTLFSIIVTSLLLVGSGSSISGLYLNVFLPTLLTIFITSYTTRAVYRLTTSRGDFSKLYTSLLALGTLLFLILIITVAVRSHDTYSANDYGRISQPLLDTNTQPVPNHY